MCYAGEDEDDSGLVVMNASTTLPPSVSDHMQITGSMQSSDDINETMEALPTLTTNVLPAHTTESSIQTSAAMPTAGKVTYYKAFKMSFQWLQHTYVKGIIQFKHILK